MKDTNLTQKRKNEILTIVNQILRIAKFNGRSIDVVDLANKNGFSVFGLKEDAEIDGAIIGRKDKDILNIIAYKKNLSEKENRFIIAHELGHFFLHFDNEKFNFGGTFAYAYHDHRNLSKSLEEEADFFAANLLMPKDIFLEEVKKIGELARYKIGQNLLSDIFNVTPECIKLRLGETDAF